MGTEPIRKVIEIDERILIIYIILLIVPKLRTMA